MATRKPTYGTGPDDIDIQATKAVRKPRTDVVDATGKPLRELTRAEKDAQYKKIKTKWETARAATKAKIAANSKVVKSRPAGSTIPKSAKPKITKAEKQIAVELSKKGMKKAAKDQAKALDKKYPGLYKKKAN
jgi:hypothetical protein